MSGRRYRRRTRADRSRPRVLDIAPGLVHESGPRRERDWSPERVAVLAHWSLDPEPSRSVVAMLQELAFGGYETVLVSAAEAPGPIGRTCTWAPSSVQSVPEGTTILRRANLGYDFGSWAVAAEAFPGIRRAQRVLLVNDSLIGPFSSLAPILADFETCPTPVWGLSGSRQHRPHLQSFFVGFRDGVLDSRPMRTFWTDIRVESRKAKIVRYDELGLSEAMEEASIEWSTMFEATVGSPRNPTVDAWQSLIGAGFPFLKAEVVNAPTSAVARWDLVNQELARVGAGPVDDWLPRGFEAPPGPLDPTRFQRARIIVDIGGVRELAVAARARLARVGEG